MTYPDEVDQDPDSIFVKNKTAPDSRKKPNPVLAVKKKSVPDQI